MTVAPSSPGPPVSRAAGASATAALAALCLLHVALAALPAAPGSNLVLATNGGSSPDWLLGPLRFAGLDGADGPLAGPLFYAGLWLTLGLWMLVLRRIGSLSSRTLITAIVGLHVVYALAPPLLSQDVFSYVAYGRLGVEHSLNPYSHSPDDIPFDAVYPFAGSKDALSVYGPLFTLLSYALVPLGVAGAFWSFKALMALCSLGVVWLVWRIAEQRGVDPRFAAAAVGLNPLVLAHVVGGAHNEALVVLMTMAGVWLVVRGREVAGPLVAAGAIGVKASAALVVPFMVFRPPASGLRPPVRPILAAAAAVLLVAAVGLAVFGTDSLDALSLLSSNQERTSRWSFPYKTAQLLGAVLPGDRLDYRDAVRVAFAVVLLGVYLWLLHRAWRGRIHWIDAAGWATLATLVASAWLVPWYALWLLPLAAVAHDRRLLWASAALCAWMLPVAVPL